MATHRPSCPVHLTSLSIEVATEPAPAVIASSVCEHDARTQSRSTVTITVSDPCHLVCETVILSRNQ